MFHFDSIDSHFRPTNGGAVPVARPQAIGSGEDEEAWVSPGFAGGSPPRSSGPALIDMDAQMSEVLFEEPVLERKKRRASVVTKGFNARLFLAEDAATSDSDFTDRENGGGGRFGHLKDDATESSAGEGPTPSRKKKKNRSKNKNKNKKKLAIPVDEGIVVSSSSTSPQPDTKENGTAVPMPIQFPKRLSPPRPGSGVSSLSTSLREARGAGFPQLSVDTKTGTEKLFSQLSIHAGNGSQGTDTSYEVPLEEDFVSPIMQSRSMVGLDGPVKRKMCAEDFEPIKMLGKGTYGTVILVRHKATGRLFAQKQLKKASLVVHTKMVQQTRTERAILEAVQHPFVVKLFYAFQDQQKLYLILEYAQGGELYNYLATERMFPEDTASFYVAELVLALSHLHHNVGVVYRDLKPENCLLDHTGHLLLTDFGLSKVAEDGGRCKSLLGTPEYMAPEILQGKSYGFEVDWWSLGALTYDLLTGSPPFPGSNYDRILQKIQKQKLKLPFFLSPDAKDLLIRLLRKEPNRRLGANMPNDLETIKKHRFFRKIDWKKLAQRELVPPITPLITDPQLAENFAAEFTDAPMSPVITTSFFPMNSVGRSAQDDLFGGFSYTAVSVMDRHFDGF